MADLWSLKPSGVEQFRSFLVALKVEPTTPPPLELLNDVRCSEPVAGTAKIEQRPFATKLEFGRYIAKQLNGNVPERLLRTSLGLWAWLTLFYLEQCCPADASGRRKVLRLEKYISSAGHISTGLDKHLLFFPWKMMTLHGDAAAWMLGGALREDSKVVREFANSYRRNVSPPYVNLARTLYFDEQKGKVRTGATTTKPGSLRRLDRVIHQLDLTYDVFGSEASGLAELIPRTEFGKWLPRRTSHG